MEVNYPEGRLRENSQTQTKTRVNHSLPRDSQNYLPRKVSVPEPAALNDLVYLYRVRWSQTSPAPPWRMMAIARE
jgi:hypothetical protein